MEVPRSPSLLSLKCKLGAAFLDWWLPKRSSCVLAIAGLRGSFLAALATEDE